MRIAIMKKAFARLHKSSNLDQLLHINVNSPMLSCASINLDRAKLSACSVSRLAPSPTGLLHLGNAWSFLLCWLAVRSANGKIYLRMDDLDPQRSRRHYADDIMRDLEWLGLDWDGPVVWQSQRHALYKDAIAQLRDKNLVYPCFCTRKDLRSLAGAPHIGDCGVPYPGTCRKLSLQDVKARSRQAHSLRFITQDRPVEFCDILQGPQIFSNQAYGSDFALSRSDGVWAYHLANAIDDDDLGITLTIRGRDLLPSVPRQMLLAEALDLRCPKFAHVPLLLDEKHERLAKRHQAQTIASLRERGIESSRIIGRLAQMAGQNPSGKACAAADLVAGFDLRKVPVKDMTCVL